MRVVNKGNSIIWIGNKAIKPNEKAELSKEELEMSGVKQLINQGILQVEKRAERKTGKKEEKKAGEQ